MTAFQFETDFDLLRNEQVLRICHRDGEKVKAVDVLIDGLSWDELAERITDALAILRREVEGVDIEKVLKALDEMPVPSDSKIMGY